MEGQQNGLESVTAWLAQWQELIRAKDFEAAQELFDKKVIGFGTVADEVSGVDELVERQWRATWPFIQDFTFDLGNGRIDVATDGLLAYIATPWRSKGIRSNGEVFDRGGRATIVLTRADSGAEWKAVHTHVSLNRGSENPRSAR
jgi:ketosteroid isomerase-like protein